MANITSFRPRPTLTKKLTADNTGNVFVAMVSKNETSYYIGNSDPTNDAWIDWTPSAAQGGAQPTAAIPGAQPGGMWIPARSAQVFQMSVDAQIAAITAGGTAILYITPGEGM